MTTSTKTIVKPLRSWNGKLERIDNLLSWLHDKDLLNKGEKHRKDTLFRQYYRWFNDGDLPAPCRMKGFTKYSMSYKVLGEYSGEYLLESLVDEFTKKVLTRIFKKYNRTDFRKQMNEDKLNSLVEDLQNDQRVAYAITYALNEFSEKSPELTKAQNEVITRMNEIKEELVNEFNIEKGNITEYTIINILTGTYVQYYTHPLSTEQGLVYHEKYKNELSEIVNNLIKILKK